MKTPASLVAATLFLVCGCTVPVAAGIDEGDANRIVVALDRVSVDATKEPDPATEGRFRILVARDDAARALVTMQGEGLPRPNPSGVLSAVDKGALVPSRAAEHAQFVAGLAGDLERTLESVDGVLSARVQLDLPEPDPLRDTRDTPAAKASVLLEHRGLAPPIAPGEIQRLLAGGVGGLSAADVAVVLVPRDGAAHPAGSEALALTHVGPFAVARASMRTLQVSLATLLALVAVLAGTTLSLYARLSRVRAAGDGKAT